MGGGIWEETFVNFAPRLLAYLSRAQAPLRQPCGI